MPALALVQNDFEKSTAKNVLKCHENEPLVKRTNTETVSLLGKGAKSSLWGLRTLVSCDLEYRTLRVETKKIKIKLKILIKRYSLTRVKLTALYKSSWSSLFF